MRRINGKLFLALLVGTAVLGGGLFVLHRFQRGRIASALLFHAKKAQEDGLKERSTEYLQRYLEFNRNDLDEKTNLAKLWVGDGLTGPLKSRARGARLLDDVLTTEDDRELRKLLVKTALGLRDFTLARQHLDRLLPLAELMDVVAALREDRSGKGKMPERFAKLGAERGLLEGYWGQVLEVEKKQPEALDCYRLATKHAPNEVLPFVRLAYLLRRQAEADAGKRAKSLTEADETVNALIKQNGSTADAYLTRWRYRRDFDLLEVRETANKGKEKLESAAQDVVEALKRKPDSVDALLCAADLERLRARAASEDPALNPKQREAGLKKHRDEAFKLIQRGLDMAAKVKNATADESGEFQLLWHKANLLLDDFDPREPEKVAGRRSDVEAVIEAVRKTRISGAADYLQGRLLMTDQKWAESAALFERARTLLATQPDLACQADLFLGQCYGRLEEHTQMYNAFKRVSDWDPTNVAARIGMAEARTAQGKLDEARQLFAVLMRQGQIPARALIDVARLEIQRQIGRDVPDWSEAEEMLRVAEEATPRAAAVEVPLMRAEVRMRQGRPDEARKELLFARDRTPAEVDLWAALADCAIRRNKPDEAAKVLDDAQERLGDRVGLRLVRARMEAESPKGKSVTAFANDLGKFTEAEQARLLSALADTAMRAGKPADARAMWERVATLPRHKADLKLHLLLFDMALRENDRAGMDRTLETIKAVEQQSGTYHRYGTALLTIWRAGRTKADAERGELLTAARADLDVVQAARPGWGSVFLARAEVATLEGNPELTIKNLEEAVKNGETGPAVIRKLIALYNQKGKRGEAEKLVARLPRWVIDKDLNRMMVGLAIRDGNYGKALLDAQSFIRDDSRDPADLVYLARVLSANRRYDEAERKLAAALKEAPADPEAHLARVQFLVERKRKEDATKAIADAAKSVAKEKRSLLLAQCHDAVSEPKEALGFYKAAVEENKDSASVLRSVADSHLKAGRLRDAEPLLRKLADGAIPGATADDAAWGRRSLALVLAGSTDYRRFTEALGLVGLRLDVNGKLAAIPDKDEPADATRARARVLASQAQKGFRDAAIRLFESLDRQGYLLPDDRFTLAMLYEADGRTERSQKSLRELTQIPLRTPRYLAQYAMSTLTSRRDAEALAEVERIVGQLQELERLREVGPNGFASVDLQARLLEARKKDDEARELIRKHVTRPGAQPEEVLLEIGVLSRQKRFAAAFELCEATWDKGTCPPEAMGGVAASLLRVMGPSDAQIAAIEARLKKALAGEKPSPILRMQLADLLDRRGRYADAAGQWREVLKADPNNFVAMNNLAWQIVTHGGDAAEALQHIDKALAGMGRRADLLDTRGLVHLANKETGKALADFKDAVADGPTPTRLLHLAQAQHLSKDNDGAKASLKRAKEAGLEVTRLHPSEQEQARKLLANPSLN